MLDGPLVFVDIDTQRDFLEPDGTLFVPGSTAIVPNLARLTRFARAWNHCPGHGLRRAPPGRSGTRDVPAALHDRHAGSGAYRRDVTRDSHVLDDRAVLPDRIPAHVTIHKREFDFFSHPLADELITRLGANRPLFVVYGVATDYCVRAAVAGLLERGCRVAIVADAIRAIDLLAEQEVLTDFARRGVLLTLTAVVCH